MIKGATNDPSNVNILDEPEQQRICDFLQGLVYCWCNNNKGKFAARDLVGGKNNDWDGTPLQCLYDKHVKNSSPNPETESGKAIGRLLYSVLYKDQRTFEATSPGETWTREYSWTGS